MTNHITTLNVMQSQYSHIRQSDAEWEAIEAAKEALAQTAAISRVEAERDAYKGRYLVTTKNNVKLEAKLNAAVAFIQRIDREYGRYIVDVGFERWRGVQGGGVRDA